MGRTYVRVGIRTCVRVAGQVSGWGRTYVRVGGEHPPSGGVVAVCRRMSLFIAKVGVEHVAYYTGKESGPVQAWAGGGAVPPVGKSGTVAGGGGGATHAGSPRAVDGTEEKANGGGVAAGPMVGYYTGNRGELPGRWIAAGGMGVVEGGLVTPRQLAASLSAVDPTSGQQLGRRYKPGGSFVDKAGVTRRRRSFSAYDIVYAPPKSVSAAWALADDADRKEIEQAFDISTRAVVGFLQSEAVSSRAGRNGVQRVEVPEGATIAQFNHWTSRAGDPHVHAHLIVHNRVRCEDGKWRTLDGQRLYKNAAAAAAVGAAVLRGELSQRLGWSWDRIGDNWHARDTRTEGSNSPAVRPVSIFSSTIQAIALSNCESVGASSTSVDDAGAGSPA